MHILMSVNTSGSLLVGGVSFDKERVSWWRVEPQRIECEQCPSLFERDLGAHNPSAVDLAAAFPCNVPLPSAIAAALQLDVSCWVIIVMLVPVAVKRPRCEVTHMPPPLCRRRSCQMVVAVGRTVGWGIRVVGVLVPSDDRVNIHRSTFSGV